MFTGSEILCAPSILDSSDGSEYLGWTVVLTFGVIQYSVGTHLEPVVHTILSWLQPSLSVNMLVLV